MRATKLQEKFDFDIQVRHFPLHPETPAEGRTLEELFAGRNIDVAASQERLFKTMQDEGLPYSKRTMTYNSRLAQELAKWAESQPDGEKIHRALFEAYFVDRANIAELDELLKVVRKVGLSEDDAKKVLESREFGLSVDLDWKRCQRLQLSSVPVFAINGRGVMGAQPVEVLEQLLQESSVEEKK
ncbi:MAG: hypothetical protein CMJ78_07100 [Planctomycetaceae bacterium]|nr:hypothetical protein [Planctomycetaceae bacterium]